MTRAEKARVLQWVVRDLGDDFPGIEKTPSVCGGEATIVRTRIPVWVLEQARRYQYVPIDDQPELEAGYVHLHRGIGDAKVFRFSGSFRTGTDPQHTSAWQEYARLQRGPGFRA
jgi:hypothetical protein